MNARIRNIESACYSLGTLLIIAGYSASMNSTSVYDGTAWVTHYPYGDFVAPLYVSGIIIYVIGIFIYLRYRKSAS